MTYSTHQDAIMSRDLASAILVVRNRVKIPYHPTVYSEDEKLTFLAANIMEHVYRRRDVWAYINWIKANNADYLPELADIDWIVLAKQMGCSGRPEIRLLESPATFCKRGDASEFKKQVCA